MHAHCLQHVPFENMGAIKPWLETNGFNISYTRFFENPTLPDINSIDWLIIMGGPMSVNDEEAYPWLIAEKQFIRECIAKKKIVIGICLGAQLIANAMGSKIYRNPVKEIGWFQVFRKTTSELTHSAKFPGTITVFHWHGETFDLPESATLIASSENCKNQIFTIGENVIAFQCHLETTTESLNSLIQHCSEEIVPAPCIQTASEMQQLFQNHASEMQQLLYSMLQRLL